MTRSRITALLLMSAGLAVVGVTRSVASEVSGADEFGVMLQEARDRAAEYDFSGVLVVEWHDARGMHREELAVRHADGVVELRAAKRVIMRGTERLVVDGDAWTTAESSAIGVPILASGKYRVATYAGPRVAGRATTVLEVAADGGAVVERFYVDDEHGIVLRRETIDATGNVVRAVAFVKVSELADPTDAGIELALPAPPPTAPHRVDDLAGPYRDPQSVGDGFRLVARTVHAEGLVQLSYTDGLFGVSVFEQPGSLDWNALPPGGAAVEIDGVPGRRYVLPVGEALVWERSGMVYTSVGDVAAAELALVAGDVSSGPGNGRLGRLARVVLAPFGW